MIRNEYLTYRMVQKYIEIIKHSEHGRAILYDIQCWSLSVRSSVALRYTVYTYDAEKC